MPRARKQRESDEPPGAAEWMVTFSDCMTLLLTFFVLLLTFSSFEEKLFGSLRVIYSTAFTNIHVFRRAQDWDALLEMPPIMQIEELDKGSGSPTSLSGLQKNLRSEAASADLRRCTAFLFSSKELFWGKGAV
ncbi:MAG: hypothetical protein AMJ65_02275, partial [Phycisphaerae bacterium SG8_4]